jgi:hypothetical protein
LVLREQLNLDLIDAQACVLLPMTLFYAIALLRAIVKYHGFPPEAMLHHGS